MKWIWPIIVLIVLLTSSFAKAQTTVSLSSLKPVIGKLDYTDEKVVMKDHIYQGYLQRNYPDEGGYNEYDLNAKYSRLEGWIGIPAEADVSDPLKFVIVVDGNTIQSGELTKGDKPIHVDVDLSGVRALRIGMLKPLVFAEPTLSKPAPQSAHIANLVAPAVGAKVTGSSVNLLWEPVDGATSYGVEIVCTKGSSPSIYSLNVKGGDSNIKFDLTSVPNGEYQWSVIAFDSKGVMGKFSKDRTFIVAK